MLQHARTNTSLSLFREAEYATIVLDTAEKEEYFKQLSNEVMKNRKNPNKIYTGAKSLRTQFLAALKQLGEVKTANIWARKLLITTHTIQSLRTQIETILRENHIYGIVEIHLQDYEMNSTHIQFVGTKAHEVERLIAELLVKLGYEDSLEAALGKDERQNMSEALTQPPKTPKSITTEATKDGEIEESKLGEDFERFKNLSTQRIDDLIHRIQKRVERLLQEFQQKNPRNEDTEILLERYKMRKEKDK